MNVFIIFTLVASASASASASIAIAEPYANLNVSTKKLKDAANLNLESCIHSTAAINVFSENRHKFTDKNIQAQTTIKDIFCKAHLEQKNELIKRQEEIIRKSYHISE